MKRQVYSLENAVNMLTTIIDRCSVDIPDQGIETAEQVEKHASTLRYGLENGSIKVTPKVCEMIDCFVIRLSWIGA